MNPGRERSDDPDLVEAMMDIRHIDDVHDSRSDELQRWVDICNTATIDVFGANAPLTSVGRRQAAAGTDAPRVTYYLAFPDPDSDAAGAAALTYPARTGSHQAEVEVYVAPNAQRRGVGRALLAHVEQVARERGIGSLLLDQSSPAGHGGPGAAFAQAQGYAEFGLVIGSRLELPVPESVRSELQALADEGTADRYELFTEAGELPNEWLYHRALLARSLSTQVPTGSIEPVDDSWDAERVRTMVMDWKRGGGSVIESVAVPEGQGRMVAFSDVVVFEDSNDEATQSDTLVVPEHRGHRLGLAVKLANLDALAEHHPSVRAIRTWTWAQNRAMQDLNRRLGFVDEAWVRLWSKELATPTT